MEVLVLGAMSLFILTGTACLVVFMMTLIEEYKETKKRNKQ